MSLQAESTFPPALSARSSWPFPEACTNAVKHAYSDQAVRVIDVGITQSVASHGLEMRLPIIKALTAKYTIDQCGPGTRTAMTLALEPRPLMPRSK